MKRFFYYLMKKCCFFFIYKCFAFVNFGVETLGFFFHNLYSHSLLPGGESLRRYWSQSWRWRGKKGSEVSIFHMNKIPFIKTINQITFIFPCSGFSSNLKWKHWNAIWYKYECCNWRFTFTFYYIICNSGTGRIS